MGPNRWWLQDWDAVRTAITVDSIVEGRRCSSPVTVTFSVNTSRATSIGCCATSPAARLPRTSAPAEPWGCGRRLDVDLGDLAPGTYTLQAVEYSAADGDPINLDSKTFDAVE